MGIRIRFVDIFAVLLVKNNKIVASQKEMRRYWNVVVVEFGSH